MEQIPTTERKSMRAIKIKHILESENKGFTDLNEYIEYLLDIIEKKHFQYTSLQQSLFELQEKYDTLVSSENKKEEISEEVIREEALNILNIEIKSEKEENPGPKEEKEESE